MTDGTHVSLFTGFPGFIGARLLPRLLELHPGLRFECLVQDRFMDAARASVAEIARDHPHTEGRIGLVVGDITRERLGLAPDAARDLQKRLTSAYHLAAVYDLAVAREIGHKVNVVGTGNVLRFLEGAPQLERLHYVSTAYVSGRATGLFRETDLDLGQSFKNFYEETKFLAEMAVVKSGLPQTTYRPAIVVGDSRTGETAKFDGPYFTLTFMERLPSPGVFFRVGSGKSPVELVPVDFVVEALALLSTTATSLGKTYHLTDPAPLSTEEVGRLFARALGRSFLFVPVPLAVARVFFRPKAVQRWSTMPLQTLDYFDHPCRHDATQATQDLASLGLRCPALPEYVDTMVAFYRRRQGSVRREAMV